MGIYSQRQVMVGENSANLSGHWRLRKGKLEGRKKET